MTQSPENALIRYRIDEARDTLDDYMPFVELDEQELKELFEEVQVMVKGIQNYVDRFLEGYSESNT